jgi:hypothetical protein
MISLRCQLEFASAFVYDNSHQRMRGFIIAVKNNAQYRYKLDDKIISKNAIEMAASQLSQRLRSDVEWSNDYLNTETCLIPMPGCSPMAAGKEWLWATKTLCTQLVQLGLGKCVEPILVRKVAVPKSSTSAPGQRPSPERHYESLEVQECLMDHSQITIVDDVVTRGSSFVAAYQRISERFPKSQVRLFALSRTATAVGGRFYDPIQGIITKNGASLRREP